MNAASKLLNQKRSDLVQFTSPIRLEAHSKSIQSLVANLVSLEIFQIDFRIASEELKLSKWSDR